MEKEVKKMTILPHGWRQEVADAMKVHRNTVYTIMQQGESHPKYWRLMKIVKEKYGDAKII